MISSSPSTKKATSLGLQNWVIARWMLGTAVTLLRLITTSTFLEGMLFLLRKRLISSPVESYEASSMMTTWQLEYCWLRMLWMLNSNLKCLALLKEGTTIQKGSYSGQWVRLYVCSSLGSSERQSFYIYQSSFCSSRGLSMFPLSISQQFLRFSSAKQGSLRAISSNLRILSFRIWFFASAQRISSKIQCYLMDYQIFLRRCEDVRVTFQLYAAGAFVQGSSKIILIFCSKCSTFFLIFFCSETYTPRICLLVSAISPRLYSASLNSLYISSSLVLRLSKKLA